MVEIPQCKMTLLQVKVHKCCHKNVLKPAKVKVHIMHHDLIQNAVLLKYLINLYIQYHYMLRLSKELVFQIN